MAARDHLRRDQFPPHTEMVPVSALTGIPGNRLRYDPSESGLVDDVRKHGIIEPLVLEYHTKSKTARLGEGNHRLEAARRVGLTHVPVRGVRYSMEGYGAAVRGYTKEGHIPGELKPSQFMDWDDK